MAVDHEGPCRTGPSAWRSIHTPESNLPKLKIILFPTPVGFPAGSEVKNPPANAGDAGSIPGSGRSPAGGNGNPLQYSCLENPMDRGAWRATVRKARHEWPQYSLLPCSSSWFPCLRGSYDLPLPARPGTQNPPLSAPCLVLTPCPSQAGLLVSIYLLSLHPDILQQQASFPTTFLPFFSAYS